MQVKQQYKTPHLTTALVGPLQLIEKQILKKQQVIENWFSQQWQANPPPVYGSVDLRNAGFKLAPVDMNLFPAGFNNLNKDFLPLSIEAARVAIHRAVPNAKKILLVPESHTRNVFYWENIQSLLFILHEAGFQVKLGSLTATEPTEIQLMSKEKVTIEMLVRTPTSDVMVGDFIPDVILLNNDLSAGIPSILENVNQPIIPAPQLGWSQRLKSEHFQHYADIGNEFAKLIEIDPWFIVPLFRQCDEVDFMEYEGAGCMTDNVEQLLHEIQKKYDEYQIDAKPFVIIKADAGTYGMAIMTVRSVDEIRSLNRKQRTHMAKSKGGQPVNKVILQEGVYTFETWGADNAIAEPVVYLWGEHVVGGFYRVHKERGIDENLNTPGMHFEPLAFAKTCHEPAQEALPDECQNRFYAYGVIARLSMLAAAKEALYLKKLL